LNGGKKTVSLLKQAIEEELKTSMPESAPHLKVMIRVYANLEGLAKTYSELDVASSPIFSSFIRGFNMGDATCDFVDAGNGKECSDEKIKGTSSWITSVNCFDRSSHRSGVSYAPRRCSLSANRPWWLD
jgi:hypothetical protein